MVPFIVPFTNLVGPFTVLVGTGFCLWSIPFHCVLVGTVLFVVPFIVPFIVPFTNLVGTVLFVVDPLPMSWWVLSCLWSPSLCHGGYCLVCGPLPCVLVGTVLFVVPFIVPFTNLVGTVFLVVPFTVLVGTLC